MELQTCFQRIKILPKSRVTEIYLAWAGWGFFFVLILLLLLFKKHIGKPFDPCNALFNIIVTPEQGKDACQ